MAKQPSATIVSITPDVSARIVAVVSPGAPPPAAMSMLPGAVSPGEPNASPAGDTNVSPDGRVVEPKAGGTNVPPDGRRTGMDAI
jgi:hypothetical protein